MEFNVLNFVRSPGFGLTLVAETLNGFFLSAEMSSTPQGQGDAILPEDLGRNCAMMLLEEIYRVRCARFCSRCVQTQTRVCCWLLGQMVPLWRQVPAVNVSPWQMSLSLFGAVGCFCLLSSHVSATAAGQLRIPGEYLRGQTRDTFESRQQWRFLCVFTCIPRQLPPAGMVTDAAFLGAGLRITFSYLYDLLDFF